MSSEEWEKVKSLFEVAVATPEPARSEYLQSACATNPDLRAAVQELLENHQEMSAVPLAVPDAPIFREDALIANRFRVVRFLARGGMGEVYEAYDERLRVSVALKTIRPGTMRTDGAVERFQRELLVARSVSHEGLCRVNEFVEHAEPGASAGDEARVIPCLTMELIEGENLAQYLERERPLTPETALPIVRRIAAALEALHARNIVHRDLKPSNVMLSHSHDGALRVTLMDFGLAKSRDAAAGLFESRTDLQAGAPYFAAPELLRGEAPGAAADIYAFGLVIDEMVTRSRAYTAESVQALYFAKLWEAPVPPRERSENLPEVWDRTILRCLKTDPGGRFADVGDIVRALDGQPVEAWPDAAVPARISLPTRRAVIVSAIAAPAAALAAVAWAALKPVTTSIGVYEIENRTQDPSYDYLSLGTTNELMRRLSHLDGLKVIPMHSTRSKGGRRNDNRFALDGTLQANAGQVRLSISVTDNRDGALVWSDNFDRARIEDPLELQSDIAAGTVRALEMRTILGGRAARGRVFLLISALRRVLDRSRQVAASPTRSNMAFDYYLRGHELLERSSPDKTPAIEELMRALGEDPSFALAYATLADAHIEMVNFAYAKTASLISSARQYAETAVSLDPNLAEAFEALAWVRQTEWNWKGAEENHLKALRLKPSLAPARKRYATLLIYFGRTNEALVQTREAFALDPYDQSAAQGLGLNLFLCGKYQEAIAVLEPVARARDALGASHNLGDAWARLAQLSSGAARDRYFREALEQADNVTQIERRMRPDPQARTPWGDKMHAHYYSLRGAFGAAEYHLRRLLQDMDAGITSPENVAMVYAAQGRNAAALDLLERAAASRDRLIPFIKVLPFFEGLRGEPRFISLLHQTGL